MAMMTPEEIRAWLERTKEAKTNLSSDSINITGTVDFKLPKGELANQIAEAITNAQRRLAAPQEKADQKEVVKSAKVNTEVAQETKKVVNDTRSTEATTPDIKLTKRTGVWRAKDPEATNLRSIEGPSSKAMEHIPVDLGGRIRQLTMRLFQDKIAPGELPVTKVMPYVEQFGTAKQSIRDLSKLKSTQKIGEAISSPKSAEAYIAQLNEAVAKVETEVTKLYKISGGAFEKMAGTIETAKYVSDITARKINKITSSGAPKDSAILKTSQEALEKLEGQKRPPTGHIKETGPSGLKETFSKETDPEYRGVMRYVANWDQIRPIIEERERRRQNRKRPRSSDPGSLDLNAKYESDTGRTNLGVTWNDAAAAGSYFKQEPQPGMLPEHVPDEWRKKIIQDTAAIQEQHRAAYFGEPQRNKEGKFIGAEEIIPQAKDIKPHDMGHPYVKWMLDKVATEEEAANNPELRKMRDMTSDMMKNSPESWWIQPASSKGKGKYHLDFTNIPDGGLMRHTGVNLSMAEYLSKDPVVQQYKGPLTRTQQAQLASSQVLHDMYKYDFDNRAETVPYHPMLPEKAFRNNPALVQKYGGEPFIRPIFDAVAQHSGEFTTDFNGIKRPIEYFKTPVAAYASMADFTGSRPINKYENPGPRETAVSQLDSYLQKHLTVGSDNVVQLQAQLQGVIAQEEAVFSNLAKMGSEIKARVVKPLEQIEEVAHDKVFLEDPKTQKRLDKSLVIDQIRNTYTAYDTMAQAAMAGDRAGLITAADKRVSTQVNRQKLDPFLDAVAGPEIAGALRTRMGGDKDTPDYEGQIAKLYAESVRLETQRLEIQRQLNKEMKTPTGSKRDIIERQQKLGQEKVEKAVQDKQDAAQEHIGDGPGGPPVPPGGDPGKLKPGGTPVPVHVVNDVLRVTTLGSSAPSGQKTSKAPGQYGTPEVSPFDHYVNQVQELMTSLNTASYKAAQAIENIVNTKEVMRKDLASQSRQDITSAAKAMAEEGYNRRELFYHEMNRKPMQETGKFIGNTMEDTLLKYGERRSTLNEQEQRNVLELIAKYKLLGAEMGKKFLPGEKIEIAEQANKIRELHRQITALNAELQNTEGHRNALRSVVPDERAAASVLERMSRYFESRVAQDYQTANQSDALRTEATIESTARQAEQRARRAAEESANRSQAEARRQMAEQERDYQHHYNEMLQQLQAHNGAMEQEQGQSGERMGNVANKAFKGLGMLAGFGYYYTLYNALRQVEEAMADYEEGLSKIRRVLPQPEDAAGFEAQKAVINDLGDALKDLQLKYGLTIEQVSGMMEEWAKSGYETKQTLTELTEVSAKLFKSGDFENSSKAVKLLNAVLHQYGVAQQDAGKVGSGMVDSWSKLADMIPADTADFAEAFARVAKFAKTLKVDFHELNAIVSIMMERTGRSGREVGTAMQSMLSFMTRPKAVSVMTKFGVDPYTDKTKAQFKDFSGLILELSRAYKTLGMAEATAFQNELADALGMARRKNFVMALLDSMDDYQGRVEASYKSAGYNEAKVAITMEALREQVNQLRAAFQNLSIAAGESGLVSAMKSTLEIGENFMTWMSKLSPSTMRLIMTLITLATTLKGIGFVLQQTTGAGLLKTIGSQALTSWTMFGGSGPLLNRMGEHRLGIYQQAITRYDQMAGLTAQQVAAAEAARASTAANNSLRPPASLAPYIAQRNAFIDTLNRQLGMVGAVNLSSRQAAEANRILADSMRDANRVSLAYSLGWTVLITAIVSFVFWLATAKQRHREFLEQITKEVTAHREKAGQAQELVNEYKEQSKALADLRKDKQLTEAESLKLAQTENRLAEIETRIAEILPEATTSFTAYGKAKADNISLTEALIEKERELANQTAALGAANVWDKGRLQGEQVFLENEGKRIAEELTNAVKSGDRGSESSLRAELKRNLDRRKDVARQLGSIEAAEKAIYGESPSKIDKEASIDFSNFVKGLDIQDASLKNYLVSLASSGQGVKEFLADQEALNGGLSDTADAAGVAGEELSRMSNSLIDAQNMKELDEAIQKLSGMTEKGRQGVRAQEIISEMEGIFPGFRVAAEAGTDAMEAFRDSVWENIESSIEAERSLVKSAVEQTESKIRLYKLEAEEKIEALEAMQAAGQAYQDWEAGVAAKRSAQRKPTAPIWTSIGAAQRVAGVIGPWLEDRVFGTNKPPEGVSPVDAESEQKLKDEIAAAQARKKAADRFKQALIAIEQSLTGSLERGSEGVSQTGSGGTSREFDDFSHMMKTWKLQVKELDDTIDLIEARKSNIPKLSENIPQIMTLTAQQIEDTRLKQELLMATNDNLKISLTEYLGKLAGVWDGQTAWNDLSDETKNKVAELKEKIETLNEAIKGNEKAFEEAKGAMTKYIQESNDIYKSQIGELMDQWDDMKNTAIDALEAEREERKKNVDAITDQIEAEGRLADLKKKEKDYGRKKSDLEEELAKEEARTGARHRERAAEIRKELSRLDEDWATEKEDFDRQERLEAAKQGVEVDDLEINKDIDQRKKQIEDFYKNVKNIFTQKALDMIALMATFDASIADRFSNIVGVIENTVKALQSGELGNVPQNVLDEISNWEKWIYGEGGRFEFDPRYPTGILGMKEPMAHFSSMMQQAPNNQWKQGSWITGPALGNNPEPAYAWSRDLARSIGANIRWDEDLQKVIITLANGVEKAFGKEEGAFEQDGKYLLPIRQTMEQLGYSVIYNPLTRLISFFEGLFSPGGMIAPQLSPDLNYLLPQPTAQTPYTPTPIAPTVSAQNIQVNADQYTMGDSDAYRTSGYGQAGTAYLQVRELAQLFGLGAPEWNDADQTVTVGGKTYGSETGFLGPDDHFYLPIQKMMEDFGYAIQWLNGNISGSRQGLQYPDGSFIPMSPMTSREASVTISPEAEPIRSVANVSGDIQGVNPELLARVSALGSAYNRDVTIESGYRSIEEQQRLWNSYPEADRGTLVASPGNSRHNYGNAVDISSVSDWIDSLGNDILAKFGLIRPVSGDIPHIEMLNDQGERASLTGEELRNVFAKPILNAAGEQEDAALNTSKAADAHQEAAYSLGESAYQLSLAADSLAASQPGAFGDTFNGTPGISLNPYAVIRPDQYLWGNSAGSGTTGLGKTDSTYMGIRDLAKMIGFKDADVKWDEKSGSVSVGGKTFSQGDYGFLKNDKFFVSIRKFLESFGYQVQWLDGIVKGTKIQNTPPSKAPTTSMTPSTSRTAPTSMTPSTSRTAPTTWPTQTSNRPIDFGPYSGRWGTETRIEEDNILRKLFTTTEGRKLWLDPKASFEKWEETSSFKADVEDVESGKNPYKFDKSLLNILKMLDYDPGRVKDYLELHPYINTWLEKSESGTRSAPIGATASRDTDPGKPDGTKGTSISSTSISGSLNDPLFVKLITTTPIPVAIKQIEAGVGLGSIGQKGLGREQPYSLDQILTTISSQRGILTDENRPYDINADTDLASKDLRPEPLLRVSVISISDEAAAKLRSLRSSSSSLENHQQFIRDQARIDTHILPKMELRPRLECLPDMKIAMERIRQTEIGPIENNINFNAPLFNSENTVIDKELDVRKIGDNLMRSVQALAKGKGGAMIRGIE